MKRHLKPALLTALIAVGALLSGAFNGAMAFAPVLPPFTQDELDTNWQADRQFPTGGVTSVTAFGRDNVARLGVDSAQTESDLFRRTEGLKTAVGDFGLDVHVDLYLDPDWEDKAVRAGLWVVGDDGAGNRDQLFGILEFVNNEPCPEEDCSNQGNIQDHEGWRIYNGETGVWTTLDAAFAYGQWVQLSIILDPANQLYHYYLDGVEVGTSPGGQNFIREVFLNSYNYGMDSFPNLSSDSYAAHWHAGLEPGPECSVRGDYLSLQDALDDPDCETINVDAGEYVGDLTIDRPLTLNGAQAGNDVLGRTFGSLAESRIEGNITINAPDVTIDGFSLTNTGTGFGLSAILLKTAADNALIQNNIISGVANTGSGAAEAIYLEHGPDNVSILNNLIEDTSGTTSTKAILIGDSTSADPSDDVLIQGNIIDGVSSTRGAYGILMNNGAGAANLQVLENFIENLAGDWAHGVGLEGDTPNAWIFGNGFDDIVDNAGDIVDAVGVFFENNASITTVEVNRNNFFAEMVAGIALHPTNQTTTEDVDGECNWWDAADGPAPVGSGVGVGPNVDFSPWLIAPALDGDCGLPDDSSGDASADGDEDNDGIADEIDTGDGSFSDSELGGATSGSIVSVPDGVTVTIEDEPGDEGVRVTVEGDTGSNFVVIELEGKAAPILLTEGTYVITDPEVQVTIEVVSGGPAEVEYTLDSGFNFTIVLSDGDEALITEIYEGGDLVDVTVEALEGNIEIESWQVQEGSVLAATDLDDDGIPLPTDVCPYTPGDKPAGCPHLGGGQGNVGGILGPLLQRSPTAQPQAAPEQTGGTIVPPSTGSGGLR